MPEGPIIPYHAAGGGFGSRPPRHADAWGGFGGALSRTQGRRVMVQRRSASTPPGSAARQAAEAAAQAAIAAARAAEAAAFAARAAEDPAASPVDTSLEAVPWPPSCSPSGLRFWYARGYPGLEDGIHTFDALVSCGVDPERPAPVGLLEGFKTPEPTLRRARNTGVRVSELYWR